MTITVAQLTSETLAGTGTFDVLMRAGKAHLTEEFEKGRIKGPDYATVYLGMMTQVLDKAMEFLLTKDKVANELLLIEAQIAKINADILVSEKEKLKIEAEIERINEEVLLVNAQKCLAQAQFDVAMANLPKVAAEVALLNQKKLTETAQTSNANVDTNSVIGRQNNLYTQQASGFIRDAEQKAAQLMISTWNVRATTDEGTLTSPAGLDDAQILRAVTKLLTGVGA